MIKNDHLSTPHGFWRGYKRNNVTGVIERVVFKPKDRTRKIHKRFIKKHNWVLFPTVFECLTPHCKNTFFVKVDLKNAYGTADIYYLRKVLEGIVQWNGEERFFFHKENGLIQGANASPILFQLFCSVTIDQELLDYCEPRKITYTRYVDDLLFSSKKPIPRTVRKVLRRILVRHGFVLNEKKSTVFSLWGKQVKLLGTLFGTDTVCVTSEFLTRYLDYLTLYKDGDKSLQNKVAGMKNWIRYVRRINKLQCVM